MRNIVLSLVAVSSVAACTEPVIQSGASYPPIPPQQVQVSFASTPGCENPREIGMIPQVGSNKYAQARAINHIKDLAAQRGANLVLLDTTATSLLGDMLIDAVMYRCG